ncbi:MAG TPA: hypothetical protein DCQ64_14095 [Candidatus Rokubacteria bacterium]|nr:hypothetical protein [Candidatus Rokubacteria bacterium]
MKLDLRPITLRDARRFVAEHHRHNEPPHGWLFGAGLFDGEVLRAVGIAGRPVARNLQDGRTVEVLRVCTLGDRNAASRLYGALCRAAAALGYLRAVTYTLESEPGTTTRAAGFRRDGDVIADDWRGRARQWSASNTPTLFGEAKRPLGDKVRWVRELA